MGPGPKRSPWRILAGAVVVVLGILGVAYQTMCPKGFVRFSGFEAAGSFSCIDYAGISTPEHYLSLRDGGRMSFFGGPLAGEGGHLFVLRTGGETGRWICGTTKSARFSFKDGSAKVERVGVILDEATAARNGSMTLSGLAGGAFGDNCTSSHIRVDGDVLQVELDLSSSGGGASEDRTRLDLAMSGKGLSIDTYVDLPAPWPERGDAEQDVTYAWVRLTEVIDGNAVRRIAVAGAGSRLLRKDGCATLELKHVTPLAVCPSEANASGQLRLSW